MADLKFPIYINGRTFNVNPQTLPANYSLSDYIREIALLKGTKLMCREGGCGACTVTVQPGQGNPRPVNSCLVPINMCKGWEITTIEGLGSEKTAYNGIQKSLADNNGSQCGYCSPGMVMSMYGKLKQAPEERHDDVEGAFDGNICRCTGYRPIMYAMQQCATDIEDMVKCHNCPEIPKKSVETATTWSTKDGSVWYFPTTITEMKSVFAQHLDENYHFVAGHTGTGVYKKDGPFPVYIDVKGVSALTEICQTEEKLEIGAAVTLTDLISAFKESSAIDGFDYLMDAAEYLKQVANPQIRNIGSWAGNLMMKHKHRDFVSDVFTLLESIGVTLILNNHMSGNILEVRPLQMLSLVMKGLFIKSMQVHRRPGWTLRCYKIMPRYKSAHSLLSLAFFASLDGSMKVTEKPSVVYAGVSDAFVHAEDVENLLQNKSLLDNSTIQECMATLDMIKCEENRFLPSVQFRKSALKSLFYKALLNIASSECSPDVKIGGELLVRPDKSTGKQDFPTDPTQYPMTQPMPKLDARKQTAGEAQYIGDFLEMKGQLHAVFVKSTVGSAKISGIDVSAATQMPGVVKVLTSKDIPGTNATAPGEIFLCEDEVFYCGQPVAIIVAESEAQALVARQEVKIQYSDIKTPILSITEAIAADSFHPDPPKNVLIKNKAYDALKDCDLVVSGSAETGEQYAMHTEPQICLADPQEGFYILHAATQVMGKMQTRVAALLGIQKNEVEVKTRRVGGGFGAKQLRSVAVANASALAAYHTQRPVRMCLTLEDNMEILGRRQPLKIEYKAGVNRKDMKIQAIVGSLYENCGFFTAESLGSFNLFWLDNAYYVPNWHVNVRQCKTNQPNHCFVRAPGILSVLHFAEQILDEVALELGVTSEQVKEANLYKDGDTTPYLFSMSPCLMEEVWFKLKESAEYDKRKDAISTFNKANKWRKKAISLVPLKYGYAYWPGTLFTVHVSINYGDGSVTVIHAGVELGQGINTKAIQVAAHTLGLPMDMIKVQPPSTSYNLNSSETGGSITSDFNSLGVKKACEILLKRMAPFRGDGMSWKEVVEKCQEKDVDLHAKFFVTSKDAAPECKNPLNHCNIFGASCAEVELDGLTGNYIIHRMDVLYDGGNSFSPEIDIGQIEGAIALALGEFLNEEIKYAPETGQLLTNNTWTYHVPMSRDIPVDLRVAFLRDRPNKVFQLRNKIVAEPPMLLAESAVTSLRKCILELRREQGLSGSFTADAPFTVEKIHVTCALDSTKFVIN